MSSKKPNLKKLLSELEISTVALNKATQQARILIHNAQDKIAIKKIRQSIKK